MSKNVIKDVMRRLSYKEKVEFNLRLTLVRIEKRTRLWIENDGKCHYCNRDTVLPHVHAADPKIAPKGSIATLDHVITQADGGTDSLRNLVLACANCNNKRGDMSYDQFMYLCHTPGAWEEYRKQLAQEKALRDEERRKDSMRRHELLVKQQMAEAEERRNAKEALKTDEQKRTERLHKMFGTDGNKLLRSWIWRAKIDLEIAKEPVHEDCHAV